MQLQVRPAALVLAAMLAAAPAAAQTTGTTTAGARMEGHGMGHASMQKMAVLDMADRAEVEMARLALARSTNAGVRRFAQMMLDEHSAAMQNRASGMQGMQDAVAQHMDDPFLQEMSANHRTAMTSLSAQRGAAFDRMYMQRQVDMHAHLLSVLNHEDGMAVRPSGNAAGVVSSGSVGTNSVPQAGGYAVPLSCDPGNSPAGPDRGRSESGLNGSGVAAKGSCDGTPQNRPMANGGHGNHAMAMGQMHQTATQMVSSHLDMARDVLAGLR
jgi:putative membrane protein